MATSMPRTIQCIPEDVVREIFSQFSSRLKVYDAEDFPWYLGHICAAWRVTFLSMRTQFWNIIELGWPRWRRREPDRFPLPWYTQRVVEMLKLFLQYNQSFPFSFTLGTVFTDYNEEEAQDVNRVLMILVSESTRWEDASINLRGSMLPTLYRIKHRLPILRSLKLAIWTDSLDEYPVPELYADLFQTAPLLTSIHMSRLSTWKFDWSCLTFIHLDCASNVSLLYNTLPLLARLQGLEINVILFSQSEAPGTALVNTPATAPVKLPSLNYLSLSSSLFLTMLKTPALVDLKISTKHWESTPELNIIDFLRRSRCRLYHLCIVHCGASTLKQILVHTLDIRYLCFINVNNLSDIFLWLASEKSYVPHLEVFRINLDHRRMEENELDNLSLMIASRAPTSINGRGIKQLTIRKYKYITASQHDALERLG